MFPHWTDKNKRKEERLYVLIGDRRHYLSGEIIDKHSLKPGDRTPFSNLRIYSSLEPDPLERKKESDIAAT